MSDHAAETLWKIVLALFNIVLLPLLYLLLRPFIEEFIERWRYRRTKAIKLCGRYADKIGYVYHMTAFLYLAPSQHIEDDYEVKGLIESELIEFPDEFAKKNPKCTIGSIGYEIVTGHCDRHLVLRLRTVAITNQVLVASSCYIINISADRKTFTGTITIIANGAMVRARPLISSNSTTVHRAA